MSASDLDVAHIIQLREAGAPHAYGPADLEYSELLSGFNTAIEHNPDLVVAPRSVDEVVAAVVFANRHDLPIRVIGRGHGALAPITEGIAVATGDLAFVEVDVATRTARVGAGASWSDVLRATAPYGLAGLCGSAPHVGVIGYLLGGGIGPVARTYGYAADHVRSITIVTADGGLVRADAHFNQDLFWAVRGGKGGFGVVVEAEIDLFPITTLYGGGFYFSAEDTPSVLRGFAEWSADLPEELTTSLSMLRLPPLPELPEPLRGRFVSHVRVAYIGDASDAEALLAPIRAIATPLIDAVGELPYSAIGSIHADPVDPMGVVDGGILLRTFTRETADALLSVVGPTAKVPIAAVEIRRLGGALGRAPEIDNAVGGRDAAYGIHVVGAPVPELLDTVIPAVIGGIFAAVGEWATGSTQVNFVGRANGADALRSAWDPDVRSRLDEVRRRHDPKRRFPFGSD